MLSTRLILLSARGIKLSARLVMLSTQLNMWSPRCIKLSAWDNMSSAPDDKSSIQHNKLSAPLFSTSGGFYFFLFSSNFFHFFRKKHFLSTSSKCLWRNRFLPKENQPCFWDMWKKLEESVSSNFFRKSTWLMFHHESGGVGVVGWPHSTYIINA